MPARTLSGVSGEEVLRAAAVAGTALLAGRVVLSLLPPGWPGRHNLRELPATAGASLAFGFVALVATARALDALGVEASPASLLGPWALLLLVRVALLPGRMRPRHEPRRDRPGPVAIFVGLAAAAVVVAGPLFGPFSGTDASVDALATALGTIGGLSRESAVRLTLLLSLASVALLAAATLERARRPALFAATAALAAALAPRVELLGSAASPTAAWLTAAAAGAVAWVRRADRRGEAAALVLLAATPLVDGAAASSGLLGLALFIVATPRASRRRTTALGVVLFSATMVAGGTVIDVPNIGALAPAAIALAVLAMCRPTRPLAKGPR